MPMTDNPASTGTALVALVLQTHLARPDPDRHAIEAAGVGDVGRCASNGGGDAAGREI